MEQHQQARELEQCVLDVAGMNCASCVAHVTRAAKTVAGVEEAQVNLARGRAVVAYDPQQATPQQIARAISESGYPAVAEQLGHHSDTAVAEEQRLERQRAHVRLWLVRAILGIVLWLPVELMHWTLPLLGVHVRHGPGPNWMDWLALATSTAAMILVGGGFYQSALQAARRRTSNMDTLIAMGTTVAYGYSLIALLGQILGWWTALPALYFMEASGLLALIALGHWLEAQARERAGSAIRKLLGLAPATALRVKPAEPANGSEANKPGSLSPSYEEVPVAELAVGDQVLIRPGDRISVDGQVAAGASEVDESMITGEPLPVLRQAGDEVISGTLNQTGRLVIRATRVGAQTALAQIVKLVEQAQNSRPPVQRLADQVAAVFVPVVLGIAALTAIGWYTWGALHGWEPAHIWAQVAQATCSVLIIACPCALGLAVPAALMVGTGRGAGRGVLIRDIDALQHAESIETVVLDKTGTITRGKPMVARIFPADGMAEGELLRLAASAEQFSEHPLAASIVRRAADMGLPLSEPQSFAYEPGLGVMAAVEGQTMLVGSAALLRQQGVDVPAVDHQHRSAVYIGRKADGEAARLLGSLEIEDEIKPDSKQAIAELHGMGLKVVLLTGDNARAAAAIASAMGIEDVRAEVRPDDKARVIRELQESLGRRRRVAMVGDGINDAPALAQADLGIAIGSGSDIAKESGGIVLVSGSLHGIVTALRLSRATMRKIRQNLFFAFIYNVLAIPAAALGHLTPLLAAGAMALSDVTVIGNALLLRREKVD